MIKKFIKKTRKHIHEVLTIKESPKSIATGFTLGTIIAVLPTFGLGVIIGLGILLIFKRLSKISMLGAFAVWNVITISPLYTLSYLLGSLIYRGTPSFNFKFEVNQELYIYSIKFLIGNVFIVIAVAIISYIIIYKLATKYQKQYKHYFADPIEKNLVKPIEELI